MTRNAARILLESALAADPGRVAFECRGRELTVAGLAGRAVALGRLFRGLGAGPGDRMLVALPDSLSLVCAYLGGLWSGVVPVLASPAMSREHHAYLLEDSGAVLAVAGPDSLAGQAASGRTGVGLVELEDGVLDGVLEGAGLAVPGAGQARAEDRREDLLAALALGHEPGEEDPGVMLYTSGSTGRPKGVPHAHSHLLATADTHTGAALGMGPGDRVLSTAKAFHAYGLGVSVNGPLRHGARVLLHPDRPVPAEIAALIRSFRPTLFFSVPSFYAVLLPHLSGDEGAGGLRACVSAGEAMPIALTQAWERACGVEVVDGIGSTECVGFFMSNRPGAVRPGTAGYPLPGYAVRVVDREGRDLPPGSPGELLVRGPSAAREYWRRPDKTRETMLDGGWLRTGDLFVEEDGFFRHLGRVDDVFKCRGLWVSPMEVENVLLGHPAVTECAVTGCQAGGLTQVQAHVVVAPGREGTGELRAELRRRCLDLLPEHLCPALVRFHATLPKNEMGKISRKALREAYP